MSTLFFFSSLVAPEINVSVVDPFADHALAITVDEMMSATYTGKKFSFNPRHLTF